MATIVSADTHYEHLHVLPLVHNSKTPETCSTRSSLPSGCYNDQHMWNVCWLRPVKDCVCLLHSSIDASSITISEWNAIDSLINRGQADVVSKFELQVCMSGKGDYSDVRLMSSDGETAYNTLDESLLVQEVPSAHWSGSVNHETNVSGNWATSILEHNFLPRSVSSW